MTDTNKYNQRVKGWQKDALQAIDKSFDEENIQHVARSPSPHPSREVIKAISNFKLGMITSISFKFPKHMVYVAKGVGKGVPAALAGTSATTRKQKDWFNKKMDKSVEDLADIVAEETGDMVVNNLRIR
jgi:hypothetical protein